MYQFTAAELWEKLNTPEGKKLMSLMQKDGGTAFLKAAAAAKAGNYSEAQAVLAPLLDGTEAEDLAKELGQKLG